MSPREFGVQGKRICCLLCCQCLRVNSAAGKVTRRAGSCVHRRVHMHFSKITSCEPVFHGLQADGSAGFDLSSLRRFTIFFSRNVVCRHHTSDIQITLVSMTDHHYSSQVSSTVCWYSAHQRYDSVKIQYLAPVLTASDCVGICYSAFGTGTLF